MVQLRPWAPHLRTSRGFQPHWLGGRGVSDTLIQLRQEPRTPPANLRASVGASAPDAKGKCPCFRCSNLTRLELSAADRCFLGHAISGHYSRWSHFNRQIGPSQITAARRAIVGALRMSLAHCRAISAKVGASTKRRPVRIIEPLVPSCA